MRLKSELVEVDYEQLEIEKSASGIPVSLK